MVLWNGNFSFLKIVNRKHMVDEIIEELNNQTKKYGHFFHIVYGPQGCGKSFILYQLAATLMKDKSNFVVYINKAQDDYLLEDIVLIIDLKLRSLGINYQQEISQKILSSFDIDDKKFKALEFIDMTKDILKESKYFYLLD